MGWLVPQKYLELSELGVRSRLASIRYRVLLPMKEIAARGYQVALLPIEQNNPLSILGELNGFDVVVLWKYAGTLGLHRKIIDAAQKCGTALVYDVCDDFSDHEQFGSEFLNTIRDAQHVTAASQSFADMVRATAGRTATIIPEPYEGPKGLARWSPDATRLKLLWFGSWTNRSSLESLIPELVDFGAIRPLALTVVTE